MILNVVVAAEKAYAGKRPVFFFFINTTKKPPTGLHFPVKSWGLSKKMRKQNAAFTIDLEVYQKKNL